MVLVGTQRFPNPYRLQDYRSLSISGYEIARAALDRDTAAVKGQSRLKSSDESDLVVNLDE